MPAKWLVGNSWGDKTGKKGFFVMMDEWFDRYVDVIVVQKKYIPTPLLPVFSTKAQPRPRWDPISRALGYE